MTWEILAPIMVRYGVEFAFKVWSNWKAGGEITEAQWAELRALQKKDYDDYIKAAELRFSRLNG